MKKKIMIIISFFLSLLLCSCSLEITFNVNCEHENLQQIVIQPTCVEKGYTKDYCTRCGYQNIHDYVDELGHDYQIDEVVLPTASELGYTVYKCSRCNDIKKDDYVDANDLVFDISPVAPSNTQNGYTKYASEDNSVEFRTSIKSNCHLLYGYKYFQSLDEQFAEFYEKLDSACKAFNELTDDVLVESNSGFSYYKFAEVSYEGLTKQEMQAIYFSFLLENPWYYYLSNQTVYDDGHKKLLLCVQDYCAKYSEREKYNNIILQMEIEFGYLVNGKNKEEDIIKTINDFIENKINYAYESDGKTPVEAYWAHSIIAIEKNKGVCEAYTKLFQHFASLYGIEAVPVSGIAGDDKAKEAHAWNIVKVGEKWYGLDITWNDNNTTPSRDFHVFYLCGKDTLDNYEKTTHIPYSSNIPTDPNATGNNFCYAIPELSETDYIVK